MRSKFQLKSTWQEDLDQILNVDTACDTRRSVAKDLLKKLDSVTKDVVSAIQDRNIEKLAPKTLTYGKAVVGLQDFQNQLLSDIIPELLTKGVPKLVEEGPKLLNELIEKGPNPWVEKGQKALSTAREISQDPSMLQSTVDDLRREVKNILKSTPEGFETPSYEVLKSTETFEVRKYAGYSVCSTSLPSGLTEDSYMLEALPISDSFNRLNSYLSGENSKDGSSEKLSMTIPVIMNNKTMNFILPKSLNSLTAPIPVQENVQLVDVPIEILAVRQFTGLATDGEVNRQRAKLEDALMNEGIEYDASSFKTFQYNPPLTVPWLRRNEVAFIAKMAEAQADDRSEISEEEQKFLSAPEAGD